MSRLEVTEITLDVPGRRLLDGINLAADPGDVVAITGPSGSGKTSLLNALAGITLPTAGDVRLGDVRIQLLKSGPRAAFRLANIGLVFQFGELLPELTVTENVALPLRLLGIGRRQAERQADDWLERLGLGGQGRKHPDTLSGGEVQRAGIARALVHGPKVILADEPTGALDEPNAAMIGATLVGMAKDTNVVVVVATHDPLVAAMADRIVRLRDGRLEPTGAVRPVPLVAPLASGVSAGVVREARA